MSDLYISRLAALMEKASKDNAEGFDKAAEHFADSLAGGGLVHLYGSGHSVLPCQEIFPRYGSYVGFNPLTDPRVMWHNVLGRRSAADSNSSPSPSWRSAPAACRPAASRSGRP